MNFTDMRGKDVCDVDYDNNSDDDDSDYDSKEDDMMIMMISSQEWMCMMRIFPIHPMKM
jgi:hypothetical protein